VPGRALPAAHGSGAGGRVSESGYRSSTEGNGNLSCLYSSAVVVAKV
jgi:hypothetical protein